MARKYWLIPALALVTLALGLVNIGCQQPAPSPEPSLAANFTSEPNEAMAGTPIQFTDLSSGNIEEWLWEFGDGDTSTGQNPTHSYDSPDTYTVRLTVKDSTSTDTEIKSVHVGGSGAYQIPSYVTGKTRAIYEWAGTPQARTVLEQIPCYCPCKLIGHRYVRDCYWKDDGTFDKHAVNCGECLHIADTAMQMYEQGKDICEIRQAIDQYYAAAADIATDTPMPEGCEP